MSGHLRAGQVAAAAGVNRQTLRYYERRGLIADPGRTLGGHRSYPAETVPLLRVIKTAQRLGFTLAEIANLIATDTVGARATAKLAEVEQQIADLGVIRDTLRAAVDAGCDDVATCAESLCCPLPFGDR